MIRPEQLADALQRLEPRDRELLSLSLHRRVPDEALARMYDYEPAEVSRRRAAAIERLADDLRVQRGEDLGSVLKALLEPGTWSGIEPAPGREFAEPRGRRASIPRTGPTPRPRRSGGTAAPRLPAAEPAAHADRRRGRRPSRCRRRCRSGRCPPSPSPRRSRCRPPPAARGGGGPGARPRGREPVLDMLGRRAPASGEGPDAVFAGAP